MSISKRINLIVTAAGPHQDLAAFLAPDDTGGRVIGMEAVVMEVGIVETLLQREIRDPMPMGKVSQYFPPGIELMKGKKQRWLFHLQHAVHAMEIFHSSAD